MSGFVANTVIQMASIPVAANTPLSISIANRQGTTVNVEISDQDYVTFVY